MMRLPSSLLQFFTCICLLASTACFASSTHSTKIASLKSEHYADMPSVESLNQKDNWAFIKKNILFLSSEIGYSWVRIDIHNKTESAISRLIELPISEIPSAEAFILSDTLNLAPLSNKVGLNHPFSNRSKPYRNLVFELSDIPPKQSTSLFLKVHHDFDLKLKIHSWAPEEFEKHLSQELIFFGMMYGALCMIVLYNFFIFLSLREKNHLLFVLFGSFTGIFISMQEGHFSQFIAPDLLWPKDILYAVVSALMSFCFTFFTIYFLDLERWSQTYARAMLAIGSIAALFLLLLGINTQPLIFSHYTLLIILMLYAIAIGFGVFVWHQGVSSAGFFALAIFLCSLGLFVEFLSHLAFVPFSRFNYGYVSIGNTAMILVFAFALADRMRQLHKETLDASIKLIKVTEEKAQSNLEVYKTKLHEVELEKEANEVRIESRAKSKFLSTMSHEIRTPMNGVLGMTELLGDTELDNKQLHYVSSINNSAKALLNVINDLLDYSKIEAGTMEIDSRLFNLEKVLDDCVSIFSLSASEAKINFAGYVEPGTPLQLKGDAEKLQQIILNLLSNAFNFTSNSDIFLRAFPTEKQTVNSLEIRFEINCTNIVLTAEEQESLFNPFQDTSLKKQHGHELGLTVSKQLTELMQGDIGVSSDEDEQTTTLWFTARLLVPHKDEAQEPEDRTKILSGRRLLVCDASEHFIATITKLTESWGMEVYSCCDSKELTEKLFDDPHAFQVILVAEEFLTPEVQLAVRQSNVDHNFITSIILSTRTRFALSPEEMKKKGIQFILEKPHTTKQLYKSLLHSMGIDIAKKEKDNSPQLNVMIAEDNNVNLLVIEGLLKKLKLMPQTAANGAEAVKLYEESEEPFDLIFMDCEMPEMDGYEATRTIRAIEEQDTSKESIIIGLSAHSAQEHKEEALEAGMNDFMVKPVNSENIEALVESIKNGTFFAPKGDKPEIDQFDD